MAPLPKRRLSKARAGKRQSHLAMSMPALGLCPQCHSPKLSHRVCPTCGTYKGRQVVEIKSPKKKG